MADEAVTEPVSPATPAATTDATVTTTPAATPASEVTQTPATDGSTVNAGETFNDKIDPKTLTGEALRMYKKYQADYTRARQADKARFDQLQNQINSFQPLLNDPDIRAKAYFLQYGRYPDGYQPTFAAPQQPKEEQFNVDEMTPVEKKLWEETQKLQQESQARAKEDNDKMVKTTNEGVKNFYGKLSPEHKSLWQENLKEITENATLYASKGVPVELALKRAFNAACADKLVELGKLEAVNALKIKAQIPKPETTVNAGGGIVQGDYATPADAVRAAIAEVKSR